MSSCCRRTLAEYEGVFFSMKPSCVPLQKSSQAPIQANAVVITGSVLRCFAAEKRAHGHEHPQREITTSNFPSSLTAGIQLSGSDRSSVSCCVMQVLVCGASSRLSVHADVSLGDLNATVPETKEPNWRCQKSIHIDTAIRGWPCIRVRMETCSGSEAI